MHIGAMPTWLPKLSASWVPLFFILSGMFFKPEESFKKMVVKKINTILIPFLFFYFLSYIVFYLCQLAFPGLIKTDAEGILDLFFREGYFNGPIWFLLSLFWNFVMLWVIFRISSIKAVHILSVLALGFCGVLLGIAEIFVPLKIAQALTALPYFYIGYLFGYNKVLEDISQRKSLLLAVGMIVVAGLLSVAFNQPGFEPSLNHFYGNIALSFIIILTFSLGIILICRFIRFIPMVNYYGRYSIIPLCLHHLIYRPILLVFNKLPPPILRKHTHRGHCHDIPDFSADPSLSTIYSSVLRAEEFN